MKAKYLFETRFDPQSGQPIDVKPQKPATVRFTQEELDQLSAQLRAEGHAQGMAEAAAGMEGRIAMAAEAIQREIGRIAVHIEAQQQGVRADLTRLAFTIGRKLAATLLAREPIAEIEALIARCLDEMRDEPRIAIRANDAVVAALEPRIADLVAASGFHGKVTMLPDAAMPPYDCSVEWADGSAERNMQEIEDRISEIINHYVNNAPAA